MDGYYHSGIEEDWEMTAPATVIDYSHGQARQTVPMNQPPAPIQAPQFSNNFNDLVQLQLQMLNPKQLLPPTNILSNSQMCNQPLPPKNAFNSSTQQQLSSYGPPKSTQNNPVPDKYNPFVEDTCNADMDISDEEKEFEKNSNKVDNERSVKKAPGNIFSQFPAPITDSLEVKSGAAFYQGLILYIPPFEQLTHTYRGSPALKMLYASFEFSFKLPVKIEAKPRENDPNVSDATVYFKDNIIAIGSGWAPHVEASVRALELLSETCYTIQAKEDYFVKCKLVNAENMKTLNLKKWEAVSEKYPKIVEVTKDSHIQKTFSVFLDSHTSTGFYEDIVCCNLTREDVSHIKSVVEFFHLTMLPCSISTNLSNKNTPCVVSIHKYTSAKKLLDILVECGGENDKFILHPPDTFKDFYKLHPNYWDPKLKNKPGNNIEETKTTLEDPALQALIMKPYENIISELFNKHKTLQKVEKSIDSSGLKKASDDFMKSTFQIDMAQSKNVAPVERMQLLLKYMEQLQEYGSRVLTSGRADMIKIYHNAIDNVRKDLDECRKDMEKEQKDKDKTKETSSHSTTKSRSPSSRRRTPTRRRSKSPVKRSHGASRRSASPRRRARSKSPRRNNRSRRSPSPRRRPRSPSPRIRPRSPLRRARSKSPRRLSPRRRAPSPRRRSPSPRRRSPSPRRRSPQPSASFSKEDDVLISIFKDQLRRYMDILRRFRIEIEDTPIEQRLALKSRLITLKEQLGKFGRELKENSNELREFQYEFDICREELMEQNDLINGKPGPNDLPRGAVTPPPLSVMDSQRFNAVPRPLPTQYPLPSLYRPVSPPRGLYPPGTFPSDQPPLTPSRYSY